MLISAWFISKVLVAELLEHRVAKRASFVSLPQREPPYFTLYSFTLIALLTDAVFEAFTETLFAEQPYESEINLRSQLFDQLLPPTVGLKRGFGYS